jgi:hypothetical protein
MSLYDPTAADYGNTAALQAKSHAASPSGAARQRQLDKLCVASTL